ncbi:hypothetical protein [Paenibacillus sp. BR1-192]|uniref:hypothetical protein n=1 Tax=Paenibacillus sp. BR1-192 TaxID=3032287 RepID=UPI00240D20BE|nr:hypothetical protein [Paenibacillus sp. BR1-192]WFB57499.1 hypothetical protein P0X86_26575 [Paenibacillus sp. BR1-192]
MNVKELIERLSGYDDEIEVKFGIWNPETCEAEETYPINDVKHYDYLDPVLYIWSE